jgi:RimJ/RimL family protein N-acetyltransferase
LSRHGLGGFVVYLSRLIFCGGSNDKSCRIFLFELTTPRPTPESIRAAEGHTFRFATIEDIHTYHADPIWDIGDKSVLAFERGDRCLLQFDGDTLVGYTWLAASSLVELTWGFHFNMPDDTVYNYKGFTAPAYRGEGFQPLRHLKLLEHVKGTGQHRLFCYVDQMNLSSLKGVKKSGYKKIGVLRCVRKQEKVRFFLRVSKDVWSKERRT